MEIFSIIILTSLSITSFIIYHLYNKEKDKPPTKDCEYIDEPPDEDIILDNFYY